MTLFRGNIKYSDITAKADFLNRRQIIAGAAGLGAASFVGGAVQAQNLEYSTTDYAVNADITPKKDATSFNNFYEFGTGQNEPKNNSSMMTLKPWSVEIYGLVDKPGNNSLDDLLS